MKFPKGNPTGINWNASLIVSLLAIAAVVLVALSAVPGLVSAALTPGENTNTSEALDSLLPKHDELAATYRDRFVGRSPFFVPPRPPERPRPRPKPKPREDPPPVEEAPKPVAGPLMAETMGASQLTISCTRSGNVSRRSRLAIWLRLLPITRESASWVWPYSSIRR